MAPRKGRRNRILMLLENCPYPADVRVRHEATTLVKNGYHVTVVCPRAKGQKKTEIVDDVVVCRYACPAKGRSFFGYIWEYAASMGAMFIKSMQVLVKQGFDIVHLHNPPDTLALIALPYKLLGKVCIYDHHDLSAELYYYARFRQHSSFLVYRALLFFEKLSHRVANHVIVTNDSYRALAIRRAGLSADKVTVVRNGPELTSRRTASVVQPERSSEPVVGYAGIIGYQDGLDHLIRAVDYLVRKRGRTDLSCFVAGDGCALPEMRALVRQLDLDHYVHFAGWLSSEEVVQLLARSLVCVAPEPSNPYNDRSTMIKIMEYMCLGKPVVAFDLPEHRVTAGPAALYAFPNDDTDLAKKIEELINNSERRLELGRVGRRRIEELLCWSYQATRLLKAYERALLY